MIYNNIENLRTPSCHDIRQPVSAIWGDTLMIDGKYRGHITGIEGNTVSLKYLGENKYMKDQDMDLHCSPSVIEKLKQTAL